MITVTRTRAHTARSGAETGTTGSGPRVPALLWQLPLSACVAVVVSLAVQWCLSRVDVPSDSFVPEAAMNLACLVLLTVLLGLAVLPRWTPWSTGTAWVCLSALGTAPLGFLLHGTRFYLYGLSGDQLFRTQYLTRLADSPALADANYAGLPPFYPAGWFWLGARFAYLIGFPPWAAYKPWAIATMALAPVLAFVLWSAVVRRPVALLVATLCCLAGLRVAAYEPYSWVLVAVVVPVAVIVGRDLGRWASGNAVPGWSAAVLAGLCLGLCAAFYTLLALYFAAVVCTLVAWAGIKAHRNPAVPAGAFGAVARLSAVGAAAAPLAALVWTPYLLRLAQQRAEPNPAARFLPHAGAEFPVPMLEFSVSGLVCALGTGWVLWSWRRSEIARVLAVMIGGCYLWYAASTLALLRGTTLLAFRAEPVLVACLFCAAGLAAVEAARWVGERIPRRRADTGRIAVVSGVLVVLVLAQNIEPALEKAVTPGLVDEARETYDDAGKRPSGSDPGERGAWTGAVMDSVGEMTGKQPRDLVVLSTDPELFAFRPYHGFQVVSPAYANPLASYDQRRRLVESWSEARNADELRAALDRSPFRPPSVFVLARGPHGLTTTASRDVFPRSPNSQPYAVEFPEKLFDAPEFSRRDVGPYAVITRN